MNNNLRVGFIGLGLMGNPMAKNILKKGFSLTVYNRTREKAREVEQLGAKVVSSPKEVAQVSDIVITMVTGPLEVEMCLFGKGGVVEGAEKELIVVDMSTIGQKAAVKIFSRLGKRGIEFLDAPVTGSTPKAVSGELTIFIGGKEEIFTKVRPILSCMGTSLLFIGKPGSGQAVKLINNSIVAASMAALAEGMLLADAQGVSRQKVAQALENVPALSPFQRLKLPFLVEEKYPTLFSVANMQKDLKLALSELNPSDPKLPVLSKVAKMYKMALRQGLGDKDIAAVLEVIKSSVLT